MPKYSVATLPTNFENISDEDRAMVIDKLMTLYSKKVYLLAYSYVKDQGYAEDISQEVFIKCYKSLKHFRGDSQLTIKVERAINRTVNRRKN